VLDLTRRICQIPAPTFAEERRAAFVRDEFAAQGLEPWIDEVGNVYARRKGNGQGVLLLAAHTDTVFPPETDLTVRQEDDRLVGPGIGDNSLSVAALLTLPSILDQAGVYTEPDLLLCADVGEEGLGDLRGIRRAVADYRAQLRAVIAVEGHHLGRIYNRAVGSRRLRVTVTGPGGHSWGAFGNASAIHVLGQTIAAIARLEVPAEPKTTFNVGRIEGGVSINTIAPLATMDVDLRSAAPAALADLVSRVEAIVEKANDPERGVAVQTEIIGDRPAGMTPEDAPIIQIACAILRELGLEPELDAGSTDANIPMAEGIPTLCIGLTTGGYSHRVDEYIDIPPIAMGLRQLALLVARLGSGTDLSPA
jgi:acetylornithine deacetylase/succinyl-diaminopimelate desuccinylase-like protein